MEGGGEITSAFLSGSFLFLVLFGGGGGLFPLVCCSVLPFLDCIETGNEG